jgi:electron transfer flavoprotein alpha subunit
MSTIMVVAEHREGSLRETTLEVLGAALDLGKTLGLEVVTLVLADAPRELAAPLVGRAPSLRLLAHPELRSYEAERYLAILTDQISALAPKLVLMGHSSQGMDLAPALAGRLGMPLVTDCIKITGTGQAFEVERLCYGGKIVESLVLRPAPTTVLTLQAGAFSHLQAKAASVETKQQVVELAGLKPRHPRQFLGYLVAAVADVDITAADILVSVGRGIGSPENISLAQALADAIGATLSCSRPVADAGWLPQSRQVGTSGKTVRPKLYIALGISGAFQHLTGMKGSDTIIAVNKDPRAPIFQVATYGIVDDVLEVLPALTERLKG